MILGFLNHSNCVVFFGVILQCHCTRVNMIPISRVTNRGIFLVTHSCLNGAACKSVKFGFVNNDVLKLVMWGFLSKINGFNVIKTHRVIYLIYLGLRKAKWIAVVDVVGKNT